MWNEAEENWTEGAVAKIYSTVLPTDILIILILIIPSMKFQNEKFWISHQNFFITFHIFRNPSVIPSESARGQRFINARPLEITLSVSDSVGNFGSPTNTDGLYPSV